MTILNITPLESNASMVINRSFQQAKQMAGHLWTHIQNFPIYAQDTRVAYASLILANLIAFQIAKVAVRLFKYIFPIHEDRSDTAKFIIELTSCFIGFGTLLGGVGIFIEKARLPLKPLAILAVCVSTLAITIFLEKFGEEVLTKMRMQHNANNKND